ncbi:hypothetical protein [Clostridium taeniosporum]|uniref:Uncharacterized protein n=1 Tax=Clostridium taeniosporum TaxID=394958 RepID=A0A1D7XKZ7_9CLOT|nr:hypothetical protein [Clostridium taeniosporum]AOR24025.1 hypothetical protein BGI42_09910 [Clostridium taeniosporum]
MNTFSKDLPIEYYGIDNEYNDLNATITEKIIHLPDNVKPKNIIRVYSNLDLIFNSENNTFKNIYYCICNVSLSIEYIDYNDDSTINIFNDYIYCPLHFSIANSFDINKFNPKISHIHLKLLNTSTIYIYLSISPY